MAEGKVPIVFDNGSGLLKAGFAEEAAPTVCVPQLIGSDPVSVPARELSQGLIDDSYCGDLAQQYRGLLELRHPMKAGIVTNWSDMEKIWRYTFAKMLVKPEEHTMMITEAPMNPRKNRVKMAEVLFDTFNVPAFYCATQGIMALFAYGKVTGLVLDSGDGVTHALPIFEGYSVQRGIRRLDIAGRNLTDYMQTLLMEDGIALTQQAEKEIVREMKEKLSFVSLNYEADLEVIYANPDDSPLHANFTMPDSSVVSVSRARFGAPEAMFKPRLLGLDSPGVHQLVYDAVWSCEIDLHRDLMDNVCLSGGTTLTKGFAERLQSEVQALVPPALPVRVLAAPERAYSVFIGASIFASLGDFATKCISKAEWDEQGERALRRMQQQ